MILRLSLTNFDKRKYNGLMVDFKAKKKRVEVTYVKYDDKGAPIKLGESNYLEWK